MIENDIRRDMNKISGVFLQFLLFLFSYIIPKQKNLVLFGAGNGEGFRGNPKYLYLYLKKDDYTKIWITRKKEILRHLSSRNLDVIFLSNPISFLKILRANYIVIENSAKDFSYMGSITGNFNIVQTWHGTPLKHIGLNVNRGRKFWDKISDSLLKREYRNYNLVCSTSSVVSKTIKKAFLNKNISVTGYPRNDLFFSKKSALKTLNLSSYHKIISYIPTFRDKKNQTSPFSKTELKKINEYLVAKQLLLVIKKHPKHCFGKDIPNLSGFSNIKDYSEQIDDVQELLVHTDLLITDYSSVFFDFCLTNKPIIYYPYDYKEYLEDCRDMYYDYYEELTGPFAHSEKELLELIKTTDVWFKDKEYQKKYNRFKKKFNKYTDGRSCERVFKTLGIEF